MKDKRHLKELKRKEKRQEIRRKQDASRSAERTADLMALASQAASQGMYENGCSYCIKALRHDPSNNAAFRMGLYCADKAKDKGRLYRVLCLGWPQRLLTGKRDLLFFADLALAMGDVSLAAEVLQEMGQRGHLYGGKFTRKDESYVKLLADRVAGSLSKGLGREDKGLHKKEKEAPKSSTEGASRKGRIQGQEGLGPENVLTASDVSLLVSVETDAGGILDEIGSGRAALKEDLDLTLLAYQISFQSTYDELLCLPRVKGVEAFWYQQETARKVMKQFRGRAILADEVGLGKTIEACLVLKEYMVRGLVKTALILVPSALVGQWQGELAEKFGLNFVSTNDEFFRQDPEAFWKSPLALASIQTARSKRHFDAVTGRSYDMVIVDEAHHLKSHATVNWRLVNSLSKTFLLLLTATPVQNKLEELYNLVTLLRPGHLQTRKAFKARFVARGNPTDPLNREMLRGLLREVMIRNTRSIAALKLPLRYATTVSVEPLAQEARFHGMVEAYVAEEVPKAEGIMVKMQLRRLLEAVGSSHAACMGVLRSLSEQGGTRGEGARRMIAHAGEITRSAKAERVKEILKAMKAQAVVFVNYRATLEFLSSVFAAGKIEHAIFRGGMSNEHKRSAIEDFRAGRQVLLATGTGGEGHNLQFCHVVINYDLPWNPMEIEQRIGRLHRIGQRSPVDVYNFCSAGSIEERILDVLDRKINMFELVMGEIDMILGRIQGEREFAEMVFEIWLQNQDQASREKAFEDLASSLKKARRAYDKTKILDEKLFGEDFGM